MILEDSYIYLEPTGVNSEYGYRYFDTSGLISDKAITTGLGIEGYDVELFLPAQNYTPISKQQYIDIADAKLREAASEAHPLFNQVINKTLTYSELVKLNLVPQSPQVPVFAIIRNPVDRLMDLFFAGCHRRQCGEIESEALFDEFIQQDDFVHHLWKDQWMWHYYEGKRITNPILYEVMLSALQYLTKANLNIAPPASKNHLVLNTVPSSHYWYLEKGVPQKHRAKIEDRFEKDITLWNEVSLKAFGKTQTLFLR